MKGDCMCPSIGHLPPCPHYGRPGERVALDQKTTITPKEAFAIVLSDIAVHCHEAIKAKDYARAIVWCEVGLSIVIVDKKVEQIVKDVAAT